MNNLQVIEERKIFTKEFKIYGDFENPLFLAKDVAEWIEHTNSRMMLQSIDDEEKVCVNNPYALKGQQEQWFLTEDGLYEVLMQSRKPIAKAFKKEVKKILKEIRKKGYYIPGNCERFYLKGVEVYTAKQIADMTGFSQYYVDGAIDSIHPRCLYLQGPDLRRFENENCARNPYGKLGYPVTVYSCKTMNKVVQSLCGKEYSSAVQSSLERLQYEC